MYHQNNILIKTCPENIISSHINLVEKNGIFSHDVFIPTFTYAVNNSKLPFIDKVVKKPDYYFKHFVFIMSNAIKKNNMVNYYKNLSYSNQLKYLKKRIEPNPYFWLYNNPTDYDPKLTRNPNFFEKYVLPNKVYFTGINRMLKLIREMMYCTITSGVNGENPKATHIWFNDPIQWRIGDNVSIEEYEMIILPTLRVNEPEYKHKVIIKDKSRRKDGTLLPVNPRSKKPIKVKENWTKRGPKKSIQIVDDINEGIPNKEYNYTRIYKDNLKLGGRFYGLDNQMTRKCRSGICRRENLVELDYKSNNPNIVYYMVTGKKYSGDMYFDTVDLLTNEYPELKESREVYRKVIKSLQILILGAKSRNEAKGSIADQLIKLGIMKAKGEKNYVKAYKRWEQFLSDNTFDMSTGKTFIHPKDILIAIEIVFEEITDYLYLSLNDKLQNIESRMMERNVLKLRELGIRPRAIHDAIIVPKKFAKEMDEYKEDSFRIICEEERDNFFICCENQRNKINKVKNMRDLLKNKINNIKIKYLSINKILFNYIHFSLLYFLNIREYDFCFS